MKTAFLIFRCKRRSPHHHYITSYPLYNLPLLFHQSNNLFLSQSHVKFSSIPTSTLKNTPPIPANPTITTSNPPRTLPKDEELQAQKEELRQREKERTAFLLQYVSSNNFPDFFKDLQKTFPGGKTSKYNLFIEKEKEFVAFLAANSFTYLKTPRDIFIYLQHIIGTGLQNNYETSEKLFHPLIDKIFYWIFTRSSSSSTSSSSSYPSNEYAASMKDVLDYLNLLPYFHYQWGKTLYSRKRQEIITKYLIDYWYEIPTIKGEEILEGLEVFHAMKIICAFIAWKDFPFELKALMINSATKSIPRLLKQEKGFIELTLFLKHLANFSLPFNTLPMSLQKAFPVFFMKVLIDFERQPLNLIHLSLVKISHSLSQ